MISSVMQLAADSIKNFQNELDMILSKLPLLQQEFKEAVDQGDGQHDNTLWQMAKHKLDVALNRKHELETILRSAVEASTNSIESINLGHTITLEDDQGKKKTIVLVQSIEADSSANKISIDSLLGSELLGKKLNQTIILNTPRGSKSYKILTIK